MHSFPPARNEFLNVRLLSSAVSSLQVLKSEDKNIMGTEK